MVQRAVLGIATLLALMGKLKLPYLPQKQKQKRRQKESLHTKPWDSDHSDADDDRYSLSWRLAVEANNVGAWRTVPGRCYKHVERYMINGQYQNDLEVIKDQILQYVGEIKVDGRGKDAWVMDVDDTCISNVGYYKATCRFGCDAFDSRKFKEWIVKGECPAIPAMLEVFEKLVERGMKVFFVSGRDEATMAHVTTLNLHRQGFIAYQRLLLRYVYTFNSSYKFGIK